MKGFLPTTIRGVLPVFITLLFTLGNTGDYNGLATDRASGSGPHLPLDLNLDENGLVHVSPQLILDHLGETGSYVTLSSNPESFNCSQIGINNITVNTIDALGGTQSFTAQVNIRDVDSPVLVVKELTGELDANGNMTIGWWQVVETECDDSGNGCSKDNCSIQYTLSKAEFNCSNLGQNNIQVSATDPGGNVTTLTTIVTVVDRAKPLLITKDFTAGVNAIGQFTLLERHVVDSRCDVNGENCTKDNCGYTITLSRTEFSCADQGTHVVTVTATDPAGNIATGTANVTIIDGVGPTVRTKAAVLELGEDGTAVLEIGMVDNGSTDNCSIESLTLSKTLFNCDDLGDHLVTLSATDTKGYSSSGTTTVTVVDNMGPVVVTKNIEVEIDPINGSIDIEPIDLLELCPDAIIIEEDDGGFDGFVPGSGSGKEFHYTIIEPGNCTKDNCAINTITADKVIFREQDIGENQVTITVYDASGNIGQGTAIVRVRDHIAPVAVSKDLTVDLDINGTASITASQIDNGSYDNVSLSLSIDKDNFSCADVGTHTITLTAVDPEGNTAVTTSTVTVRDVMPPLVIPKDIEVNLDSNGSISINPSDLNFDSSDACGIMSFSLDKANFNCSDIGANVVTLQVTDINGNMGEASATIIVNDVIGPQIIPKDLTVDLDEEGKVSISSGEIYSSVNDACGVSSVVISKTDFDCSDIGINKVTITATGLNGNVNTAEANVIVQDVTPPLISFNRFGRINLFSDGFNRVPVSFMIRTYCGANGNQYECTKDNCGYTYEASKNDEPWVSDTLVFNCNDVGGVYVRIRASDASGNTTLDSLLVDIGDTQAPIITPKSVELELDANGRLIVLPEMVYESVTDACEISLIELSKNNFSCVDIGENTVVITASDIHGNSRTAESTVTIKDNTGPVIETKNVEVELDENGRASISPEMLYESINDNCTLANVSISVEEFDCSNLGENTVTIIASDVSGNITQVDTEVSVIDRIAPTIVTKHAVIELDENGNATIEESDVLVYCDGSGAECSRDNCGGVTAGVFPNEVTCNDVGQIVITVIGRDNANNNGGFDSATATVKFGKPKIRAKDVTLELGEDGFVTLEPDTLDDGSAAACTTLVFTASKTIFSCQDLGTQEIRFTVTTGRGEVESTTVNVTVIDNVSPVIVTKDIIVALDENNFTRVEPSDLLIMCSNDDGTGSNQINCTIDNCSIDLVEASKTLFGIDDLGDNQVVVTVNDASGNKVSASAIVTVVDRTPPVALKRNLLIDLLPDGKVSINVDRVDAGSTDNVAIVERSLSKYEFDCSDVGVNEVFLTLKDAAGNETVATSIITIRDQSPPTANLKDITLPLNGDGTLTITGDEFNDGSTDACGVSTFVVVNSVFSCNDLGNHEVMVEVSDVNGNSTTTTARLTVVDTIRPTISPKNYTLQLDEEGKGVIVADDVYQSITDNCSIEEIIVSKLRFDCQDIGSQVVTITATDKSGNSSTKQTSVEVVDLIAPVVEMKPQNIVLDAVTGRAQVDGSEFLQTICENGLECSKDNCGFTYTIEVDERVYSEGLVEFDCNDVGELFIKATLIDLSGNVGMDSVKVKIIDAAGPTLSTVDYSVELDISGHASINTDQVVKEFTDNCSIDRIELSKSEFTCADIGTNTVTVSGYDKSGNEVTKEVIVTVRDVTPPVVNGHDIEVYLDNQGLVSIIAEDLDTGSTDQCGLVTLAIDKSLFSCQNVGRNEVILIVTDEAGLESQKTFAVEVRDTISPVLSPKDLTVELEGNGKVRIQPGDLYESLVDNCSIKAIEVDIVEFTCTDIGENTVEITAEDLHGNKSTWASIVKVVDNTPPTVMLKPIKVFLNAQGRAEIDSSEVDSGSVDNCSLTSFLISKKAFRCVDLGDNLVTVTVTDSQGNKTEGSTVVSVLDSLPPLIIGKDISIALDESGRANLETKEFYEEVTDNCVGIEVTASKTEFDCDDLGEVTVTVTASDIAGNKTTTNVTVTVLDTKAPFIISKDISVMLSPEGVVSVGPEQLYESAIDNCEIVSVISSRSVFDCTSVGVNEVILTATDASGNSSTAKSKVTVKDVTGPVVRGINVEIELDEMGLAHLSTESVNSGTSDVCGEVTLALSKYEFTCGDLGENSVIFSATDQAGNQNEETILVTVIDRVAPALKVRPVLLELNSAGSAVLELESVYSEISDNCGFVSVSISKSDFDCGALGINTVEVTATDKTGNQTVSEVVIEVVDRIKPVIIGKTGVFQLDDLGRVSILAQEVYESVTDNCGVTSIAVDKSNFDCSDIGSNYVLLTAVDGAGNTNTTTVEISIVDKVEPEVLTKGLTVYLDRDGLVSLTPEEVDGGSNDACGIIDFRLSKTDFSCTDIGHNSIDFSVTDGSGNIGVRAVNIEVLDTLGPALILKNVEIGLNNEGIAVLKPTDIIEIYTDNCQTGEITLSKDRFSCLDLGVQSVKVSAVDQSGNKTMKEFLVTVLDSVDPILVTKDVQVELDGNGKASITPAQLYEVAKDNCQIEHITISKGDFDCSNVGKNQVLVKISDLSGNSVEGIATVAIVDNSYPQVDTKSIVVELSDNGVATVSPSDVDNGSFDNCGIEEMTLDRTSFSCTDLGEHTLTLRVKDIHGNSNEMSASVMIVDRQAPIFDVNDISISLNNEGAARLKPEQVTSSIKDNCRVKSITLSQSEFDCSHVGERVVTATVEDFSGNATVQEIKVMVNDQTGPVVLSKSVTLELNQFGMAEVTPDMIDNGSTDACGVKTVSLDKYNFNCQDKGVNSIRLIVEDVNGNKKEASAIVTVVDNTSPVIITKDAELFLDNEGLASIRPEDIYAELFDNCQIDKVELSKSSFNCQDVGLNEVTITASDDAGNQVSVVAIVTVKDTIPPVVQSKEIALLLDRRGQASLKAEDLNSGSSDACDISEFIIDKSEFNCEDLGENLVKLTVKDVHGNVTTSEVKVEVIDNLGPIINGRSVEINLDDTGNIEIEKNLLYSSVTDNCSFESIEVSKRRFDCRDVGENRVVITAKDSYGNVSTEEVMVKVFDRKAPKVLTKNIEVALDHTGIAVIKASDIDDGSSDACGIELMSLNRSSFSCTDLGTNEIKLTVKDAHGNTSERNAIVTVIDSRVPAIVVLEPTVDLDVSGRARLQKEDFFSSTVDNCGIDKVEVSQLAFGCSDIGENKVSITVIDKSGNVIKTETKVIVRDTSVPEIRTRDITIQLDVSGQAIIKVLDVDNGSRDNCGLELSLDRTTFDCSDVGIKSVILTGRDKSGNEATQVARVTVIGDTSLNTAVTQLSLSPIDPICESEKIVIGLQNTVDGLIYSLISDQGQVLGKGVGNSGVLEIEFPDNDINTPFSVYVSNNTGCSIMSNISALVVEADLVEADFVKSGMNDKIVVDIPIQFYDRTAGMVNEWEWVTTSDTFNIQDPLITFRQQGIRSVKLFVESTQGCTSEKIRNFIVEGEWMAVAPTAFSPNASLPENRIFRVITRGLRNERLIIYDRSGRVVHNGKNEWSGMITSGGGLFPGPYIFEFKAETVNGVPIFKRGRFMLL